MFIITLSNEKGGTGKTTSTITIGAGLAKKGYRTLIIDGDAQGHATRALGLAKYPGLYDMMVRKAGFQDVLKGIPAERYGGQGQSRLGIIGSNVETRNIAMSISDAWRLAECLEPLDNLFDYCLIDTSPTPSLLHGSIYLVTDAIIYPTLCEFWSFDGLAESLIHRKSFEDKRQIKVGGIVPTRVRAQTLEHTDNLQKLKDRFGSLVWEPIPERIVWAESATAMLPVFVYAPESEAARDAQNLINHVEALGHGNAA